MTVIVMHQAAADVATTIRVRIIGVIRPIGAIIATVVAAIVRGRGRANEKTSSQSNTKAAPTPAVTAMPMAAAPMSGVGGARNNCQHDSSRCCNSKFAKR